jgi:response regulator RpfG family c-di-GMP phosphodiesterase
MPAWVAVQIILDVGLVGVILWLSWRPNAVIAKQRAQLANLLHNVELKRTQLEAQLQQVENALRTLRGAEVNPSLGSSLGPLSAINPYEEAARLARQGYTVDEIANRAKLPRGEVDLIMHLKERGQVHV